jgi:hypothetical protein
MKKVVVFSTQTNKKKSINTDATTYGVLRRELESQGFSLSGTRNIIKENKVSLSHDDAELPEGDFTLYLFPTKTKSGLFTV